MKQLYFLRHAESPKHPVLTYTLDEITHRGEESAQRVAQSLKGRKIGKLETSPYKRALRTAKILGDTWGLEAIAQDEWSELSRGIYNERPYKEFLDEWAKQGNDYDYVPPNGESVNQGRQRIIKGMHRLVLEHSADNLACVTHAGVVSNLLMMLFGTEFEQGKPSYCGCCVLDYNQGRFSLNPTENAFLKLKGDILVADESLLFDKVFR